MTLQRPGTSWVGRPHTEDWVSQNIALGSYPPGTVVRIKNGTGLPQLWTFVFSDQSKVEFTLQIGAELAFTIGTNRPEIRIDKVKADDIDGENVIRIDEFH